MAPPRSAAAQKLKENDPDLLPSDEDDSDFHLSGGEDGDGSSSDSDDEGGKGRPKKRAKVEDEQPKEPVLDQAAVEDLWASFNDPSLPDPYTAPPPAAASTAPASSTGRGTPMADKGKGKGKEDDDMITIQVEYKFAGETISQGKSVPRSSAEAQAWLALHPDSASAKPSQLATSASSSAAPAAKDPTTSALDALFGPDSVDPGAPASTTHQPAPEASSSASPAPASTSASASVSASPAPGPKGGPRKKAAGGLGALAASLGVGKPAKLNTLEKSKLDWTQYVSKEDGLSDTLAHARKDGYLEKKDFLDRVEMRKEEGWEKGRKRPGR
ncbi:hypothetical protein JCM21900_000585 [Sporobolomyces salmonicolor]